ncbi:MAG: hypothetical protein ACREKH_16150, partial [Candidatus Rokuibacteriota bacterium]
SLPYDRQELIPALIDAGSGAVAGITRLRSCSSSWSANTTSTRPAARSHRELGAAGLPSTPEQEPR